MIVYTKIHAYLGSEPEVAHAALVPAEMVGDLVADRALDLSPQQLGVVAEIAFQRVAVDHDVVAVVVAGDGVADVVAVGVVLATEMGDEDRDLLDRLAELLRQAG